ncbi:DNA repair protein rad18, partial [Choiromyces venosus 120613-1]
MAYLTKQSQKIIDVTDPSDWTDTRLPVLKSVDSALRCQICKDYYHTPVMTNCCHTFCSECIRRSLVREQKCPVCRATAQENQLRKNGAAQEFVDAFGEARGLLMEMATTKEESVTNRKKGFIRNRVEDSMGEEDDEEEEVEDDVDSFMASGLVACPICNQYMKVPRVDAHIESGSIPLPTANTPNFPPVSKRANTKPSTSTSTPNTTTAPPEPLPKIAFNVMNEPALRRRFRKIGIPSDGSRKVLQDRYNEWLTIWNANVDSITPKSKKELLRELSAWEVTNRAPVVEKTKASGWSDKGWSEANKSQFDELIKQAK